MSRRLAAEVLGLSHTGLRRWIDRGDIPVVYSESGRVEIPVAALMDLYEDVNGERVRGRSHVLDVETAPASMLISMEADVYPARDPGRAIEVDSALGDGSPFHRQYGYYAHGSGRRQRKRPRAGRTDSCR